MGFMDRLTGSPRDRFAAEALRLARRVPGAVDARYDREKFAIEISRTDHTAPIWVYLSNVYGECAGASRAERRHRLERLLRVMAGSHVDEAWEAARPKLRPVLRPVTFGQVGVAGMVPPISRAAVPHLREFVVVDQPESMSYVTPARLETWGVTPEEVFDAAHCNLATLARESVERQEPGERVLIRMVDTGDAYFTSLLLAPGWLADVSERRGAPMLAFVPDTNTVILTDLPSDALDRLYEMVEEEYREAVRNVSPVGYVAGPGGAVMPYAPPADHPDHFATRRAEVVLAMTEYGAQERWLSQEYQRAGMDDLRVAPLRAAARPGAAAFTFATWTDAGTTLLPQAHFISFARPGSDGGEAVAGLVPWRAVAELVDLRPEPLLTPVRYRVGAWPPPDVMEVLLAQAVT
jgi:uncharacterized protein YtpQ (UPF0354 family)